MRHDDRIAGTKIRAYYRARVDPKGDTYALQVWLCDLLTALDVEAEAADLTSHPTNKP